MKKLLIILLCVPFIGFGQTIINGSFENNTSGVCRTNLSNLDFNNYMHDCLAFGTANEIDIQNDQCGYASPTHGNWFISLAYGLNTIGSSGFPSTDELSMSLSIPLIVGTEYEVSFFERADTTYYNHTTDSLFFGIFYSGTSFGTQVFSSLPIPSSWNQKTFTFIATFPANFLTIKNTEGVNNGWNFIDNIQLTKEIGTSIEEHSSNKELLKVIDILGREVNEKRNTPLFYIYNDGTVEKRIIIE